MNLQITATQLAKNFFFSYLGNFVGSLLLVAAASVSGVFAGNMMPVTAAVAKTSLPFAAVSLMVKASDKMVCMDEPKALPHVLPRIHA